MQALLRQAQVSRGVPGAVVRHGDDDAGALLVLLRGRDNRLVVLADARAPDGSAAFVRAAGGDGPVTPDVAAAYVERAVGRDPDLWVIEFDADDHQPPFPARVL